MWGWNRENRWKDGIMSVSREASVGAYKRLLSRRKTKQTLTIRGNKSRTPRQLHMHTYTGRSKLFFPAVPRRARLFPAATRRVVHVWGRWVGYGRAEEKTRSCRASRRLQPVPIGTPPRNVLLPWHQIQLLANPLLFTLF